MIDREGRRWEEDDAGSQYPVLRDQSQRKKERSKRQIIRGILRGRRRREKLPERQPLGMRVPIRVQLALLVLLTSMLALAVISISTVRLQAQRKIRWDGRREKGSRKDEIG